MADEPDYAVRLTAWLAEALGDSAPLFEDFSTEELGLVLPAAVVQAPDVVTALQEAASKAGDVGGAGADLETAAGSGDDTEILAAYFALGVSLTGFYLALNDLTEAVNDNVTTTTVPNAAERADAAAFAQALAERISDYVLASAITRRTSQFAFVLRILGLLDWRYVPASGGLSRDHVRKTLELDRVKDLINDPATHYRQALGWGDTAFDPLDIFRLASDFFQPEDDVEAGVQAGEPFLRIGALLIRRDSTVTPPCLRLTLVAAFDADRNARVKVNEHWGAGVSSDLRMTGTISAELTPPLALALQPPTGDIKGRLEARFDRNKDAQPFEVLGGTGMLTVTATNATLGLALEADWDVVDGVARVDPLVFAKIDGLTLKLGTTDADSFIGSLLSGAEIEGAFDLGLEWRATTGLLVTGSGGIELALPLHRQLGPVEVQIIYVALRILDDGTLSLETSTALGAKLGPVRATVDRLGARLDLGFAAGTDARFGPFDLALRFKPPTGLGLAVDAGPVVGGGFISYEPDKGRYTGVLQLAVAQIQIKAIGLLDTKLPGGQPGYSFLLIVSAEFPPIQLGMGFTLNGVGGLAGIQRTMVVEALQAGIRSHAVDHILFPADPVANAPQIVSDLQTFFPPAQGRYVFGPMALLAYGSGPATLVEAELGVLIELPAPVRLVLLGQISAHLPSKEAAVCELHLDLIGVLDFAKRTVAIDATLHDSRLSDFPLTGDMALRLSYGDQPQFALALGGFNPRFTPPPAFPALGRLTLTVAKDDGNPTVVLSSYFALTSNTVQFGARADLSATALGFSISGWAGLDVLVSIPPFSFIADLSAGVEVKKGSVKIASVSLTAQLSGPAPWHLSGKAAFDFIVHYEVPVEATIGEAVTAELPPADPWPELKAALQETRNWRAVPGPAAAAVISRRSLPEGQEPFLDPLGGAALHEKALPLNRRLEKFGEAKVDPAQSFDLAPGAVTVGAVPAKTKMVQDYFAPAQFAELSDAEKLSRPGFELMDSGFELESEALALGSALGEQVELETLIVDDPTYSPPAYVLSAEGQAAALSASASARSGLNSTGEERFSGPPGKKPPVSLAEERYLIVDSQSLKRPSPDPNPKDGTAGKGAALEELEDYLAAHPDGRAEVVPVVEAA